MDGSPRAIDRAGRRRRPDDRAPARQERADHDDRAGGRPDRGRRAQRLRHRPLSPDGTTASHAPDTDRP
ncbi:hypothetical protein E1264_23925 [Actinomadura sp. KC216]|nr:hypothetical protein E1264_23925 [Actinomadura sp. KC216]